MNTQTFAQAQNIVPNTDEELMAATGGGIGTALVKGAGSLLKFGRNALAADAAIGMASDAINGDR